MNPEYNFNNSMTLVIDGRDILYKGDVSTVPTFEADFEHADEAFTLFSDPIFKGSGEMEISFDFKFDQMIFWKRCGMWDWAATNCPNRRVAYLMNHGKNHKVKMKNFYRAVKILGKCMRKR